jgi:hypothetical protein
VESQFKVSWFKDFPNLVFIFWSPGKCLITQCINFPVLVFLDLGFFLHLVDKNSAPTWSPYPDLVFMLNPRAINCPPLVYVCYCLFKVSFHVVG